MEWGEHEEWLRGVAEDTGELPKALADKKAVTPQFDFYWRAFWTLSGDRPMGAMGGVGKIPFLALDAFARRFGVSSIDDFEKFLSVLGRMDAVYLDWLKEKAEDDGGNDRERHS